MNFRQLHNEKGITLVELLAALGLLAIVITLSAGVLMQLLGSEEEASANISLKQNTNVLLSEMRNQFTEGRNICYDGEHGDLEVVSINLTNGEQELTEENGCFTNANNSEAMQVKLTVKSKTDKTYTTETTWNKSEPYNLAIQLENSDDIDDVENDEEGNPPGKDEYCDYYGDKKFSQSTFGEWNSCLTPTVHQGNAWFPNGITIFEGIRFTIDYNLFSDQAFIFNHNSKAFINKSAKVKGDLEVRSSGDLNIKEHLITEGNATLQEDSRTKILRDARFEKDLKMTSKGELEVGENFSTQGNLTMHNNSHITVNNNGKLLSNVFLTTSSSLNIKGTLTSNSILLENKSTIFVNKKAELLNSVRLKGTSMIHIKGDAHFYKDIHVQDRSKIIVEGNATFDGPITPKNGAGSICVKGDADIKQMPDSDIKITQNDSSCGR